LFLSSCVSVEKPAGEPPRLIVRGDDMGMNHTCNLAVKKSFEEGILTCASLMVPAPWFEEAARMSREHPEWCIGLHLTLNSEWREYRWKPVLPITEVPSLVDEDGYFYPTTEAFLNASPDMREVEKELRAQMELAKKRGVDIQYIDTHMWTARATPELFSIVKSISQDYDLPISQDSGEERLSIYEVPYQLKEKTLERILRNLQTGLWLLVVHPGLDTLEERALVDINPEGLPNVAFNRAAVTRALTSKRIKNIVRKRGIRLIDYRDIRNPIKK
jgi:chitin disaccharide deacetylase